MINFALAGRVKDLMRLQFLNCYPDVPQPADVFLESCHLVVVWSLTV